MEWLIGYLVIGLFISSLTAYIQIVRYAPFAEFSGVGWLIGIVLWPIVLLAFFVQLIRDGW